MIGVRKAEYSYGIQECPEIIGIILPLKMNNDTNDGYTKNTPYNSK
jgi:hypothetical protein